MPRRALLWLAGLALVVGALLLTDRLLWAPGLTEDNVRRLRLGMTLAEIEALLGGPTAALLRGKSLKPSVRVGKLTSWSRRVRLTVGNRSHRETRPSGDGPGMSSGLRQGSAHDQADGPVPLRPRLGGLVRWAGPVRPL